MALANYTDLQASVIAWSNRGDAKFQGQVPDFIRLGEGRIFRKLRLSGMITTASLASVVNAREIALPADWLEFKAIRAQGISLEFKPAGLIYAMDQAIDNTVYGIEGRNLVLGDLPSTTYPVSARYYARPAPLATTPTNWVMDNAPTLYLYAALIEGAIWRKDPNDAARYGVLLEQAIDDLRVEDEKATSSGSPLRINAR